MHTPKQKMMAEALEYVLTRQNNPDDLLEELQTFAMNNDMNCYVKDSVNRLLEVNEPPVVERIS